MTEALRIEGFESDGRSIKHGGLGLFGTLEVQTLKPILTAQFPEIQRQAGLIVKHVLRKCNQPSHRKPSMHVQAQT